ncbi:MAG: hypothetical protein O2884_02270 [Chloroflexi bacterium]|nr:hypothetical protein [Chloroflexota bacterium]
MISLMRLILRFTWLTLLVLGVRRAMEMIQGGADQFIDKIEEGESGSAERTLARLHEALHHRQSQHAGGDDPFGEM